MVPSDTLTIAPTRWYGTGDSWWLNEEDDPISQWEKLMPVYKRWGFNVARLAFYFSGAPIFEEAAFTRPLDMDELDKLLDYLYSNGVRSVVDYHLGAKNYIGSPQWMNDWLDLVQRFKNDKRIIAWELKNEPQPHSWYETITKREELLPVMMELVDKIRATGDRHTIVLPSPWYWGYKGRAEEFPDQYRRENIAISFHFWDHKETLEEALAKIHSIREEWQHWMAEGFMVWLGETGVHNFPNKYNTTWEDEREVFLYTIKACIEDGVAFNIWRYNKHPTAYDELLCPFKSGLI